MQPLLQELIARTEFYLCLSHALRTPMSESDHQALTEILLEDLQGILQDAGYPHMEAGLTELDTALHQQPHSHLELLKTYSKLFVIPPVRHSLNAGMYLDQTLMGSHAIEITAFYNQHGLERSDQEYEITDHLCVQLEFVAWLLANAIEHLQQEDTQAADAQLSALRNFIGRYIAPWVEQLNASLQGAINELPLTAIYLAMGKLVAAAIRADLDWLDAAYPSIAPPQEDDDSKITMQVADVNSPEALQEITARLKAAGLDTKHLHIA